MGHLAHPARARPEKKSPAGGDRVAGPALRVAARARCARRATNGWTGRRAWGYDRGDLRMKIRLVAPAERFRAGFLGALGEFQREGLAWWIGGDLELAERDFAAFVAKKLADAEPRATREPRRRGGVWRRGAHAPPRARRRATAAAAEQRAPAPADQVDGPRHEIGRAHV